MPKHYYNEFDPRKVLMLKQMMVDGLLPKGDIDERSIVEVQPGDLDGYTQCHFFAGIGGWPVALKLAGWPSTRPVWTGSCPCQPFSKIGKHTGKADERHLWPVWENLISECRPAIVYGEQVATAIAKGWLDDVHEGLEAKGYAIGAAVLPACSVGAPHKRDRLWFVGHSQQQGLEGHAGDERPTNGWQGSSGSTAASGGWSASNWRTCTDGKARLVPTEPDFQPLAYGFQYRRWLLHAAGDAIVPQVASEFIIATMNWKGQDSE